jgi:hypothetical protein
MRRACGVRRSTLSVTPSQHVALVIPDVEALNVKLKALIRLGANRFHKELIGPDHFLTGVAVLSIGWTAPEAGNAIVRERSIGELATNGKTNGGLVHGAPPGNGDNEETPDSPGS